MTDSRKTKKQLIEELDQLRQQVSELKKESANKPDFDPADCRLVKKALGEAELQNSEVISSVGEGIVVYDREFRIQVWNPFMERLSGMTADQVRGKTPFDLFPHLRERGVDRLIERALAGETVQAPDTLFGLASTGMSGWVACTYSPRIDSEGNVCGVIATVLDVTERRRAEDSLHESREKLRTIFASSPDAITATDMDGVITACNSQTAELHGFSSAEEMIGVNAWSLLHPDFVGRAREQLKHALQTGLASSDKLLMLRRDGSEFPAEISVSVATDSSGRPSSLVAVTRDITERRKAEEALRESEGRLSLAMDVSGTCVWRWNLNTGELTVDDKFCELLGYRADELPTNVQDWGKLHHPDELETMMAKCEDYIKGVVPSYTSEHRLLSKSGSWLWVITKGKIVSWDEDHNPESFVGIAIDITEGKRAEERLRESEKRFKQLSDATWEAIAIHDNGVVLEANDQFYDMFGFSPEELVGQGYIERTTTPESAKWVRKQISEEKLGPYLATGKRKDGSEFPMELRVRVMDYQGREVRMAAIRDVSEQVEAEQKLRESEEKHRGLIENLPQKIFHKDANSVYISCNESYASDLGIRADEIAGKTDFDFYPRELADKYRADDQRLMASGKSEEIEESYVRDGEELLVQTVKTPLTNDAGNVTGILGTFWDITDRKRAEMELESTAAFLDEIVDMSPFAMWVSDSEGTMIRSNRALLETLNLTDEQLIGKYNVLKDENLDKQSLMPKVRAVFDNHESVRFSMTWTASDSGNVEFENRPDYHIDLSMFPIVNTQGELTNVVCQWIDVTERKRAEEALRESEQFSRAVIENSPLGISVRSRRGKLLSVNRAWRNIWQISDEAVREYFAADPDEFMFDEKDSYLGEWQSKVAEIYRDGGMVHVPELRLDKHRSGEERWVSQTFYAVNDNTGQVDRVVIVTNDITKRKLAEERLRISKEKFEQYLDVSAEIVISLDAEGNIDLLNESGHSILGYADGDLVGRNWFDTCLPEALRSDVKEVFYELMAGNLETAKTYENPVITNDGDEKVILWHNSVLRDGSGNICGLLCSGEDITDRKRAEEAVRESEEKFRTYIASAPDAIFVADARGRYIEVNDAACKMTGYSQTELLTMSISNLLDPLAPLGRIESYERLKDLGRLSSETSLIRKDGSTVSASLDAVTLSEDRFMAFCSDIGEAKAAAEALQESEETYRALIKGLPDTVMRFDRDGRHLFASENVEEIVKIPADEFIGKTHRELDFPEDLCQAFERAIRKVLDTGSPHEIEFAFDSADRSFVLDWRLVPEFDAQGAVKSLLTIARDITQHRRLEHEYQTLFQKMLDGFALHELICDDQGEPIDYRFLAVNPAFERMTGLKATDVVGKTVMELMPDTEQNWVGTYGRVVQTGEPALFEDFAKELDKHFEVTAFRSAPNQFACIFTDITETKRLKALESRAERLETAGTIAGQVAHDFNNLLSPIMAYPEFVHEELPHDNQAHAYLDAIENAAQKIADINQDLLTMGRRGHYNQSVLDLNRVVLQAAQEMELKSKTVTCGLDLCEDLMKIKGGDAQIHRMLTNLIVNARDAMDDIGQITIKTENYYADDASVEFGRVPKGEYIKVTVTDNGCGIPDDIVQKVLDPFFSTKTTDKKRGSGLGLSVVDAVMRDHGGYLDLSSKVGHGTSFYLYFPVTREDITKDGIGRMVGGSETVLVVDDDDTQREVSSKLLRKLGYRVTTVESGEEAVEFLRDNPQDLVVLDMVMPGGMDGTETYRQFLEFSPHQRAIILSGFSEYDQVIEAQKLGAGTFVRKPVTRQKIASAVRTELDREARMPVI